MPSNIIACCEKVFHACKVVQCLSSTHHYLASTDPLEVLACQRVWEQQLPLSGVYSVASLVYCLTPMFSFCRNCQEVLGRKELGPKKQ